VGPKPQEPGHCGPLQRAEKLLREARELRRTAAAATADLRLAKAHRAEARAGHLERLAALATVEARAARDAEEASRRRAQDEHERAREVAARLRSLDPDALVAAPHQNEGTSRG
jgi:hypothetical protein